jgi:parallel beta-helix repeat protein
MTRGSWYKITISLATILIFINTVINPIIGISNISKTNFQESTDNILYVGGSGPNNYTTIQSAINAANIDDTVFVYDDSSPYREQLQINKRITLVGEEKNTTIIDTHQKGTAIKIKYDGVVIKSFTIANASTIGGGSAIGIKIMSNYTEIKNTIVINNWWGIYCYTYSYNTITSNIIENNVYGLQIDLSRNDLIYNNNFISNVHSHFNLVSSNNCTINNNIFRFKANDGIHLYTDKDIIVTNNSLFNCGISFLYTSFSNFSNNTIDGKPFIYMVGESNKIITQAGQIYLKNCFNITIQNIDFSNVPSCIFGGNNRYCLISDNTFNNCSVAIMFDTFSSNNIIRNNTIMNTLDGIRLSKSKNSLIIDNYMYNSYWIDLYECDDITITNNTIINGIWSIYLYSSDYCNITHNKISQGLFGIYLEIVADDNTIMNNHINNCKRGIKLEGASNYNFIYQNNFVDNVVNAIVFDCHVNIWSENYWDNWIGLWFNFPFFQNFPVFIFGFPRFEFDWNPSREPYDI